MDKVISSNITRNFNKPNDELYELLKVQAAIPVPQLKKPETCDFRSRNDKRFIPKKNIKQKVKTVRDIRNLFEEDVLSELPAELDKQQNYILRKIKGGLLKENKTKSLAKKMLDCDKPLTKSSWQMLMNINPAGHTNSMQYALWNGKPIRINGSRGGKNKFLFKYDLGRIKQTLKKNHVISNNVSNRKKGLLQNSLSINFKPGPLKRKYFLDDSYQKYHVGNIDVVNLPKPGLEIQPSHGSALEQTISNFVNRLRKESGYITPKWAEFAVSVLGTVNGSKINQISQGSSVTFDLSYKHDQTQLLMRQDLESKCGTNMVKGTPKFIQSKIKDDIDVLQEVQNIMEGILDAVEINLNQDNMFKLDDEIREDCQVIQPQTSKDRQLKKRYCELDRLDVTVIRLNESGSDTGGPNTCSSSFCVLGCVCNSLQSAVILKGHCGRIDCMFQCKCDFSKYKMVDAMNNDCSDLLPGLFNLNKEINCTLSKEEQKFHQTVIVSGDKSILLKSKKRNCKSAKKYEDYYTNACLKSKSKVKPVLTIIEPKLNCENIEPWCMVHNLYKCFCKGRFTETILNEKKSSESKNTEIIVDLVENVENTAGEENNKEKNISSHNIYPSRTPKRDVKCLEDDFIWEIPSDDEDDSCARIKKYDGRKYSDGYYLFANNRIHEMEVNDFKLRKRLNTLINNMTDATESYEFNDTYIEEIEGSEREQTIEEKKDDTTRKRKVSLETKKTRDPIAESSSKRITSRKAKITMIDDSSAEKPFTHKPKLVAWFENSYQEYKRRLDMGILKNTLEPPQRGKVALYQWDFILNRYSERKNLFLVTKQPPYRIFMAVNMNDPLFDNCIDINDIRFADLNKYPTTVKNLLTNTTRVSDYFCILYGYNHCWEFIGTVTKLSDQKENDECDKTSETNEENTGITTNESSNLLLDQRLDKETAPADSSILPHISEHTPASEHTPKKKSKWFIMTVEDDFTEIQFYNKGFFVKYTSIIKAIDVARLSGKTVRLSSQKCANEATDNHGTQFGIYAIPNANEYCVFIGPYEVNESLGVETVKTFSNIGKRKRTRGVWISTDKVDNLKVIDNPLSFMPSQRSNFNDLVTMENGANDTIYTEDVPLTNKTKSPTENKKVKPIKIRKTNGFFHLGNKSVLKTVTILKSPNQQNAVVIKHPVLKTSTNTSNPETIPLLTDTPLTTSELEKQPIVFSVIPTTPTNSPSLKQLLTRPVAPEIKIASVYSESESEKPVQKKRKEGGMFILKPDEINRRLVIDGNKSPKAGSSTSELKMEEEKEMDMDIELFLDTSAACKAPENESFVISDDEELPPNSDQDVKVIFIESTNIENLGALRGEMHETKGVRFDFPGFRISDYYKPEEAFIKINQLLSRRVYIPDDLKLEWRIVNSMSELKNMKLMKKESFGSNLVLTPQGIQKQSEMKTKKYPNIKTYMKKSKRVTRSSLKSKEPAEDAGHEVREQKSKEFKEESKLLENETNELLCRTILKKSEILQSIADASDIKREEFSSALKDIDTLENVDD